MIFLETRDGHRFQIQNIRINAQSSAADVFPIKKSDFEWFTSHAYRFEVKVWDNDIHAYTLTGCQTEYDLNDYERGSLVTRVIYEQLISGV